MRLLVLLHPRSDPDSIVRALSDVPGLEITTLVERSLFAVARIRAAQPDVIVADVEWYESDRDEPLSWLSSRSEAPHTVLLRREGRRGGLEELAGSGGHHYFTFPREREAFVALMRGLAAPAPA
jgi:AmiR/NasT family two-component response regulator